MPTFWKTDLPKIPKVERENKKPKTIPKISKKKQKRISENGGEKDMFLEIWSERPHECFKCGKVLTNPKPHNFDHIEGKGMNKDKRLDKSNIRILCMPCHFYKTTGLQYRGIDLDL